MIRPEHFALFSAPQGCEVTEPVTRKIITVQDVKLSAVPQATFRAVPALLRGMGSGPPLPRIGPCPGPPVALVCVRGGRPHPCETISLAAAGEQQLYVVEHLGGMRIDVDVWVEQAQASLSIQNHGLPIGEKLRLGVGRLVVQRELPVEVRPQLELHVVFLGPGLIFLRVVEADSDNVDTQGGEVGVEVAVPATLDRSTIAPGERVEPDDCWAIRECGGVTCAAVSVGR